MQSSRFVLSLLAIAALATPACDRPAGTQESPPAQEVGEGAAASDAEPTLARGRSLLLAQKYDEAVEVLRALTEREPDNARAWLLLGTALHSNGAIDEALAAHLRAVEFEETAPRAIYNTARAHALQGDPDEAFAWLGRLDELGTFNMTQILVEPDLEGLEEDPRFAALLPTPEEFADPFVEPVRVIHQWTGEAEGDAFGWIARNIGDVDGDGVNDVTTSAPNRTNGEPLAGKVYVYSGQTGELLWSVAGQGGDQLGLGIEAAGDTNADGIPDVIAGAPGGDRASVYSGNDGSVLLTLVAENPGENFGREVTGIGDLDGDGFGDVLVGAPGNDDAGEDAGRAVVFSGKDGTSLLTLLGEEAGDAFGSAAAGAGSGGETILVVGAPNGGAGDRGQAYVYLGASTTPRFVVEAEETGSRLGGMFVSVVGDVDADGTPDVYASDWADGTHGPTTGRIYVHSGRDGSRLLTLAGEAAGDGFGIGPADAGDVDGDGHDDLVVGAWQHSSGAPGGGKVYWFSGSDGSPLAALTCKVPGDTFGFDATGMGDVDGDGRLDFLLTSAWSAINGGRSGRMFIVAGN